MSKYSLSANPVPEVVIIGAGATGLLYGAFLSKSGCRVTMLARRQDSAEAVARGGIDLEDDGNTYNYQGIAAVTDLKDAPTPDLLIVCVKGPDTSGAVAVAAQYITPETSLLTLQNGIGNVDAIAEYIPREQIMAGVSYAGSTLLGPNRVRLAGRGPIHLGELHGGLSPRLLALAQIFERSGLKAAISDNIRGLVWTKLLVNAGINPLAALTRLKNGELASLPEGRALMSELVAEGALLAEKLGIRLDVPDPVAHTLSVARATGENAASMLQDILLGRKTEIESINGMLVKKAFELDLDLPLNRTVTMLLRLLGQRKIENGLDLTKIK